MAPCLKSEQPAPPLAGPVDAEIAQIGAMSATELRKRWREVFGCDPPSAFSKDLLAHAIAWRLQERAYGGLKPQTLRLLRAVLTPGAEPPRQVKVGSVIVREHRGVLHEVMVVPGGFCWNGQTYDSLSTIARRITGVSWNGPRFFGLRAKTGNAGDVSGGPAAGPARTGTAVGEAGGAAARATDKTPRSGRSARSGRRSSIRTGGAP